VFYHFNYKAWIPLVNKNNFDDMFNDIDKNMNCVVQLFRDIRFFIVTITGTDLDFLYHGLFVFMFFMSLSIHSIYDEILHFRRLVVSICLILLLGGLSYWIAPAEGAYIFRVGDNLQSSLAQIQMHSMFNQVKVTGVLPPGYFVAPPAAMPSLHIAHATAFLWFAWKRIPWLALLYVPMTSWLFIESVCSAFHYLADLPVGILVAVACVKISSKMLPDVNPLEVKHVN
jgi:hypothetical protein